MRRSGQVQAHPWIRFLSGFAVALLIIPLVAQQGWPSSHAPRVVPIAGCNFQEVLGGTAVVYWTSSFSDGEYPFAESGRNGSIVRGEGAILEVTVQWSVSGADASKGMGIDFRGDGFTPSGVEGHFVNQGPLLPPADSEDPSACGVDVNADSYGSYTFLFSYTKLHKPGQRAIAKGNAQFNVSVEVEEEQVRLGTNLHVATGPDPEG